MPDSSADAAVQQLANANAGEANSIAIISIKATNLEVPFITAYIMAELITRRYDLYHKMLFVML